MTRLAEARAKAVGLLVGRGLSRDEAEEQVQEALAKLFDQGYDERGQLVSWLVRVAMNRYLDQFARAKALDRRLPRLVDAGRDELGDAEYRLDAERALASLLPRQRALLRLVAAGVSVPEIARAFAVSDVTVKSRIHRARETARRAA